MGKCVSCFKVPPPPDSTTNRTVEKDKEGQTGNMETTGLHFSQDSRSSLTVVDTQSNGNSKGPGTLISSENNLRSEKRMFYSRIPPLGRSASGDGKKGSSGKEISESKINALFDQYKDGKDDVILAEGIEKFCSDLDVTPDEFRVLALAWKLNAEQMCRFTKQEFVSGCKALRVDSIKGIQAKFPELLLEVQDPENFKDLYRFTFKFGLDSETGQRILPADMAICLWKLVFSQKEPPILQRWIDFLEKHPHVRGIPRDTWNMFLNFSEAVGDDLSNYDDAEAWPSLFDDFVEYENDQMNQNITRDKDSYKEE